MNKLAVLAFALLCFFSTMLWYLAESSLNDYLKSQVVLQGNYYSDLPTKVTQATFINNTGKLTFDQLALADVLTIDEITVQLAPVDTTKKAANASVDISAKSQLIIVEKVTINKMHIAIEVNANGENNLVQLEQKIALKLATDYPALYPELAAELYAKAHPELNVNLDSTQVPQLNQTNELAGKETNTAIIESKAAKKKKQLLGKASTRITILSLTVNNLIINKKTEGDSTNNVNHIVQLTLPIIGKDHGLASNQIGGEMLRVLLNTINQLP